MPRHPERANSVLEIFKNQKINAVIKSDLNLERENSNAIIINATGKLDSLYDFAEIAFIGGSLFKKYGGHNLIEAAKNKCAIIVGPYMKNFEDILNLFKNENACVQIESKSEYYFLQDGTIVLSTKYQQTMAKEKIWFINENVR